MTVAEYKREWFDARRAELHARGLKDSAIAQQMGYKAPYFSQVVKADTIGDNFIDRMCSAFGFKFVPQNGVAQSANSASSPMDSDRLVRIEAHIERLANNINALTLAFTGAVEKRKI